MTAPAEPTNETSRLKALRELLILDTTRNDRFDKVVRYAAKRFDMPMAAINLVDKNQVLCKSVFGLPEDIVAPRESSICGHTILETEVMIVEDLSTDPRFHESPFVTGFPHLRFYAGRPLTLASGLSLGTLCLMDRKPRKLSKIDLIELGILRDLLISEILHPESVDERLEHITSSAPDIVGFVNALEHRGLDKALFYLNARTPHRFTGVFRFDGDTLINMYLVDKYTGSILKGEDTLIADSYCGFLTNVNSIQFSSYVPEKFRHINTNVKSYCGVLIKDADGKPFGSLCHFDTKHCETRVSDLPLLEYVGEIVSHDLTSIK